MAQNKALRNLLEVVVGSTEVRSSKQVKSGRLRKIATRVYTTNMDDSPEDIIRRNVFYILGQLYPHAVISHRSAFELKPTNEGDIFLTYKYTKKITLPGITVHLLQGPMGTDHDMPFIENLYISSTERRMLENLQLSQAGLTIGNERIVRWCNITDLQSIRNESRFWIGSLFFPKLADCLPTFVSFLSLVVLSLHRKLNAW